MAAFDTLSWALDQAFARQMRGASAAMTGEEVDERESVDLQGSRFGKVFGFNMGIFKLNSF